MHGTFQAMTIELFRVHLTALHEAKSGQYFLLCNCSNVAIKSPRLSSSYLKCELYRTKITKYSTNNLKPIEIS